jgi:hypothetical protein
LSPGDLIINKQLLRLLPTVFDIYPVSSLVNMKFTTVVATILSMAVFAVAAPVATGEFDLRMGSSE